MAAGVVDAYGETMRTVWVTEEIAAPASTVWQLLVDTEAWPGWGPSVRDATIDGGTLRPGATGRVTTAVGVTLPFRITDVEEGRFWSWRVLGIPATDHRVRSLGPGRCEAGFGVPWPAAPYLAVCRLALHRLRDMATAPGAR